MTIRTIHFTLDFEADLGTAAASKSYDAAKRTDVLISIADKLELPLTIFCEGEILEKRYELVQPLIEYGAEIELHAFDHTTVYSDNPKDRVENLLQGLRIYQDRMGKNPEIYRAPNGAIDMAQAHALNEQGVRFDSSVFPTMFPGRFDFSKVPRAPFRIAGTNIIELPFATMAKIRIPVALSYYQLMGPTVFKGFLKLFPPPDEIVFDFHMHDLVRGDWHKEPGVPKAARWGYARAQSMPDPSKAFEAMAQFFISKGYKPEPLSALCKRAAEKELPEVALP